MTTLSLHNVNNKRNNNIYYSVLLPSTNTTQLEGCPGLVKVIFPITILASSREAGEVRR